ncbi:protein SGT1 homolog [Diorhabda sublineata]|uniref:protein SGT1 homolog n=1 Tax=Diorhabda sublineata TaxID=1163346 RepID=UPI0024E102CD|nr:protein SGT1 homolog [Diorhabda sublineata]
MFEDIKPNERLAETSNLSTSICLNAFITIFLHETQSVNKKLSMEEQVVTEDKATLPIRYEWYQTDAAVIITVLVKNVKEDYLQLTISTNQVSIKISHPDFDICDLCLNLSNPIIVEQSSYKLTPYKIEIKLKKSEGLRWEKLEGAPKNKEIKVIPKEPEPITSGPPAYPTSKKGTDWNRVVKEIMEEEAKEKPEGDDAVNKLFQEIYSNGGDEVKRAMNKSFMESNGTVLSTNWNEISKQKVEVKPPDGMEWKKY